jgi:hypothetical protein
VWCDDAIELLFSMPYTCGLDVIDDYPDGLTSSSVGKVINTTRQNVDQEIEKPHVQSVLRIIRRMYDDHEQVEIPIGEDLAAMLDEVDEGLGVERVNDLIERDLLRLVGGV